MNQARKKKAVALQRRELQENKGLFVFTPLAVSGVLIACMLASVLLANRITVAGGDMVIDILNDERPRTGMNISITIDEEELSDDYVIRPETDAEAVDEEEWNFSREWKFSHSHSVRVDDEPGSLEGSLNPIVNGLHNLFLLILLVTSINYLLGALHQDRRDSSVLFWKSMPVSGWQELASKVVTASLIAPVIYLLVSMFTQVATVFLAMLITWRMDMDPTQTILGNIDFLSLFRGQISGLLIWVAWTVPLYAWVLLCSSVARRSPLMLALGIPIGLIVLEQLFIGSDYLATAFSNHVPHPGVEGDVPLGFYIYEPQWSLLDFTGMFLGLLVAAGFLFAAVWFRKHRFEI